MQTDNYWDVSAREPTSNSTLQTITKTSILPKNDNPTPTLSNWRANEFFEILGLLKAMSSLAPDDDFFVGEAVHKRAGEIITEIYNSADDNFPKILPEGEDSLSLTWDAGELKRFLTIYADSIEQTLYHKHQRIRCVETLSSDKEPDYQDIFQSAGLKLKSRT